MEVYQQVSIIHTGYCSGTRDTSFCPGAACCHWSILFEYNQWSLDTQGTSRLSGLWPINLPHYEKNNQWPWIMHFSSNREDGQYINTPYFWGMLSLRISWEVLFCAEEKISLPHAEMAWSHCFRDNCRWGKKLTVFFWVFSHSNKAGIKQQQQMILCQKKSFFQVTWN